MRRQLIYTPHFTALLLILTLTLSFIYVPIATSQNSETIKKKLGDLQEDVSALPLDEAFENINAAEGQRKALVNKIKAVIHQVESGAYGGAVNKLENDLINTVVAWVTDEYEGPLIEKINDIIRRIKGFPVAAFSFEPETPTVGEVVTFDASASYDSNGYIVGYAWDFGDGTNGTGMIVDHIYLAEGTFTVTLTVTDNDGLSDTARADVSVSPIQVHDIAVISVVPFPTTVVSGQSVKISVTVENQGDFTESFSVTTFYDDNVIGTQTVTTLAADTSMILTYMWTTVDVSEGIYTISANATVVGDEVDIDDNTYVDDTVTVVSPPPHPPVASFTFSPTTPYTEQNVTFDASSSYDPDGTIVSYTWSYGDSATDNGLIVKHSYADNGTFTVELTVVDNDGLTDIESESITVLNRPPVASFTESATSVSTGTVIHFNASDSHDPDGYIVSYLWDFGDGTSGAGVTTEHAYADDGLYIVTLTVTDDDGAIATVTAAKAVSNRPPTASFTENATTAYRGEAIRFNASASFDPDGYITSYFWNFGDGTNKTGVVVDHTYVNDGTYTVTLIITDDDGAIDFVTATKTVLNHPPIASFIENATTIQTGVVVRFEASASYDPDGTIISYFWTFGDGTNATGVIVTHAYADDGTYSVNLTVTDNDGATASLTAVKTVLNRPPGASFTESALTASVDEIIQFNASASYDPDGSIMSYTWDFGDGNITTMSIPIINHTYTKSGTYNVTLTVTDNDGLTDDQVKAFTIEAASWPLWLILAIILLILLILAATILAIYFWRKRRRAKQDISSKTVENYKLTILLCL